MNRLLLITLLLVPSILIAEPNLNRRWTDSTGTRSFVGKYMGTTNGNVIILKDGKTEFSVPLTRLHNKCQAWVRKYENERADEYLKNKGFFDKLQFGDSQGEVLRKLKSSEIVISHVGSGIFDGLTGIDGKFCTKNKIGGLQCFLYFNWAKGEQTQMGYKTGLSGLEFKSETVPASQFDTTLKNSWSEMVQLFSILYGEPSYASSRYPQASDYSSGRSFTGTHRWKLSDGATVSLGTARDLNSGNFHLHVMIDQPQ